MDTGLQVGTLTLAEEHHYTKPAESPCDVKVVRIPAGVYPIYRERWRGQFYLFASLPGTLIRDEWHGTNTRIERPNTPTIARVRVPTYSLDRLRKDPRPLGMPGRLDVSEDWETL